MNAVTDRATRGVGLLAAAVALTIVTPPGHAIAEPPGFPDLNAFAAVPVDDYFVTNYRGNSRTVNFSTPYNVNCSMDASDPKPAGTSTDVQCTGDLPDAAPGECVTASLGDSGPGSSYHLGRTPSQCSPFVAGGKQLGVGQKLTYQNVTCAVGADQLMACLDTASGRHGFVLKPSGSEVF